MNLSNLNKRAERKKNRSPITRATIQTHEQLVFYYFSEDNILTIVSYQLLFHELRKIQEKRKHSTQQCRGHVLRYVA